MQLSDLLATYFDALTSSMRFTVGSSEVNVQRRRDGVLEALPPLGCEQKTAFMASVERQTGGGEDSGVFRDGSPFQFMWLSLGRERVLVVKRARSYRIRPLAEMGIEEEDGGRIRKMLRPPEGVIVVSCPWAGLLTGEAASVLLEGWCGTGETGAHIADFVHGDVPGLMSIQVDSTNRQELSRTVNTVRKLEILPVVITLFDEKVAIEEAFRLAQLDYRVYVVCDSRSIGETVGWLRQKVDRWVLSEYLAGIISLRDVPSLCPQCSQPNPAPDLDMLRKVGLNASDAGRLRNARGCPACQGSGMGGAWLLAWEMLSARQDETFSRLLKAGAGERELMEAVERMRGTSLEDRARGMLLSGRADLRHVEHAVFRRRHSM